MKLPDLYISSFYKSNIPRYFTFYQKKVFQILGYEIHQICNNKISHGDFLNKVLTEVDAEYFIFFDIDCIPLSSNAITELYYLISDKKTIAGAAQTANQFNDGKNLYVGPFFFGISRDLFFELGRPDLNRNENFDVGGQLTDIAKKNEIKFSYWYPTEVEVEKWELYKNGTFGIGTTYDNKVYHLFESRTSAHIPKLIRKAKGVIYRNINYLNFRHLLVILEIQLFRFGNWYQNMKKRNYDK